MGSVGVSPATGSPASTWGVRVAEWERVKEWEGVEEWKRVEERVRARRIRRRPMIIPTVVEERKRGVRDRLTRSEMPESGSAPVCEQRLVHADGSYL